MAIICGINGLLHMFTSGKHISKIYKHIFTQINEQFCSKCALFNITPKLQHVVTNDFI